MQRLLLALLLAVFLHTLLILVHFPGNTTLPPRLAGEKNITINLRSAATPEHTTEKIQEDNKTPETAERVPEEAVKKIVPVALRAKSLKIIHRTPSPITTDTVRPQQDSTASIEPVIQATTPISVKASPLYTENPKPDYPALARRRNWQGTVIVSVFVSKKGEANRVELHKSSGYLLLDKSALKAVTSWRFIPGTEAGHPVAMEVLIPVHFKLH